MASDKISTAGGDGLGHNPFGALSSSGLPTAPKGSVHAQPVSSRKEPNKNRGRVDITRETGGRGGKTVSVISGFIGIGESEKEKLCKAMRGACGCGGTVKEGRIEIQGDQRETIARILTDAGYRPVFAGG
jgi:translation initiation factor 1